MDMIAPSLLIEGFGQDERRHELREDEACTVGRAHDNAVVLLDPAISRHHFQIVHKGDGWWIEDLGSRNGTEVNDQILRGGRRLESGDRIQIGTSRIIYTGPKGKERVLISETEGPMTIHAMDLGSILSTEIATDEQGGAPSGGGVFFRQMNRVSQALLVNCPLSELPQKIVDLVGEVLQPDRAALMMPDGEEGELVSHAIYRREDVASEEIHVSRTIAQRALEEKEAILVSDAQSDQRFHEQHSVVLQNIQSALCVPLWNNHEVVGLIYADKTSPILPLDQEALRLLTLVGNMAAVKLSETKAYEELSQRQVQDEQMENAQRIQQGLLPDSPVRAETYIVAGSNEPCFDVGGDYFDIIEHDDGHVTLVLGDVSGKGMPAALLMAGLHANVHAYAGAPGSIDEMAAQLNDNLHRSGKGRHFVTAFLARFDPASGRLDYVNAGHPSPLLLRRNGDVEELATGGIMLGAFPGAAFEAGATTVEKGDQLLIVSDGVTEAGLEYGDEDFGDQRLLDYFLENRGLEPEELVKELIERVHRFTRPEAPGDDITVLMLRRLG